MAKAIEILDLKQADGEKWTLAEEVEVDKMACCESFQIQGSDQFEGCGASVWAQPNEPSELHSIREIGGT